MKTILCVLLITLSVGVFAQTPLPCDCSDFECGCCVIGIPLVQDICANFTWTPNVAQLTAQILVHNIQVWEDQIEGPQDISVCVDASPITVCLDVIDVDLSTVGACGNVLMNVTAIIFEFNWDLGTFQIGQCAQEDKPIQKFVLPKRSPTTVPDGVAAPRSKMAPGAIASPKTAIRVTPY